MPATIVTHRPRGRGLPRLLPPLLRHLLRLEVLRDAESFARDDLCRWFALGDALGTEEVGRIAGRMSDLIGIDVEFLQRANGRVDSATFVRELLRDERRLCEHDDASLTAANPYPDRPTYQGPDPTLSTRSRGPWTTSGSGACPR